MLEVSVLVVVLVITLYLLVKREEPKGSKEKNIQSQNSTNVNNYEKNSLSRLKIKKNAPQKKFEHFNTKYGYVKNSNSPDSVFDFMDWYLLNNLLLTNNDYVDFEKETFLGYPKATSMYLEDSRVYFLDENGGQVGYYDIGFENEQLIVNTEQGTYYIDLDAEENLNNFRVELSETKDVIVYDNSKEEFFELDNSQKPFYMQENTVNEEEVVDAVFEEKSDTIEELNPALASGIETSTVVENQSSYSVDYNEDRYQSNSIDSSTNY